MTLNDLKPGEEATVHEVGGEVSVARRLLEMGLTRGTVVKVIRRAPLGDPLQILLRGYHLSLRRSEARQVQVSG